MDMIRTFIAIELPDRFLEEIKKIESELDIPGVKIVAPEQVHITMKFLGNINESDIEQIISALEQIICAPFEAKIKGIGVFPKPAYIRVIWLGAQGNFEALHNEIERVLVPFRFGKDHQFSPHATLARVKLLREKALLLEKIKKLEDIDLSTMNVGSICLKKSTLTPHGPIYETLKEINLK
jgi:2'-5' RNA ligase